MGIELCPYIVYIAIFVLHKCPFPATVDNERMFLGDSPCISVQLFEVSLHSNTWPYSGGEIRVNFVYTSEEEIDVCVYIYVFGLQY